MEQIAKSITKECDGLPLGIITMAGNMKGVDDIREWRDALEDLRQSRVRQDDMEEEVFRILRFSYTHLSDSALQRCFLYCALFPEDFKAPFVCWKVVFFWKVNSRKVNYFPMFGSVMKNKLENTFQCLVMSWKMSCAR